MSTQGQWPGPPSAAERKADEVRENLMGSRPRTTASATEQASVPEPPADRGPTPAPEQASTDRTDEHWLVEPAHTEEFRRRWGAIKATFVDDPREAVRRAEELTDEVVRELTTAVESRRRDLAERLQDSGPADDKAETERLRVALNDYRGLLSPILQLSTTRD
jgi:hypothetical protein